MKAAANIIAVLGWGGFLVALWWPLLAGSIPPWAARALPAVAVPLPQGGVLSLRVVAHPVSFVVLPLDVPRVADFIEQREEFEAVVDSLPGAGSQAVIRDALVVAPTAPIGRDGHAIE